MTIKDLAAFSCTCKLSRLAVKEEGIIVERIAADLTKLYEMRTANPKNKGVYLEGLHQGRETFLGTFIHNESLRNNLENPDRYLTQRVWVYTSKRNPLPKPSRTSLCTLAAAFGKLEWLKILRRKGYCWGNTLRAAAGAGHLDVLKWAWDECCPWINWHESTSTAAVDDFKTCHSDSICMMAAVGGHLPILIWARNKGAQSNPNNVHVTCHPGEVSQWAAFHGDLAMLDWLHGLGTEQFGWMIFERALTHCNLEVLKWVNLHNTHDAHMIQEDIDGVSRFNAGVSDDGKFPYAFSSVIGSLRECFHSDGHFGDKAADLLKEMDRPATAVINWLWEQDLAPACTEHYQEAFQNASDAGLTAVACWGKDNGYLEEN